MEKSKGGKFTADEVAKVRNVIDVRKSTSNKDVALSGNGEDMACAAIGGIRHVCLARSLKGKNIGFRTGLRKRACE